MKNENRGLGDRSHLCTYYDHLPVADGKPIGKILVLQRVSDSP